jgi:uncharacterized protein involved in response to NO
LLADRVTTLVYLLVTAAAATRVGAAFAATSYMSLLELSAALWILAFCLFILHYAPFLVFPRVK